MGIELNLVLNHTNLKLCVKMIRIGSLQIQRINIKIGPKVPPKTKKRIRIETKDSFGINNYTSLVRTCVLFSLVVCVLDFKDVDKKGK
jgi:hypothetical protein